jgi:hypothetical protein
LTVSGVIRLVGLFAVQSSLDVISQQLRLVGLFADASVALLIYLAIRTRTGNALQALIPASLFLTMPAMSTSPLYFFHSDAFGYPILALSVLTLARRHYFIGTTLLATATIFKIHPILALLLVMIWLIRIQGLRANITSIVSAILGREASTREVCSNAEPHTPHSGNGNREEFFSDRKPVSIADEG